MLKIFYVITRFDMLGALNVTIYNSIPFQDQQCKVIMLVRFDDQKDRMNLIKALDLLKYKNWLIDFIGSGSSLELYKPIVNQ